MGCTSPLHSASLQHTRPVSRHLRCPSRAAFRPRSSPGPGAAPVPLRLIGLVTAARLLLLPLLGLGLVMGAYALRLFPAPDPIYLLVLLIQNTAPTAIMVGAAES